MKSKAKHCLFSLLHYTIQSLLKNKDSLELLYNEFDHEFAAIALTETWHNKSNNTLFNNGKLSIPGYQSYVGQTSETKCGGSGFFVSENLKVITPANLNNDDCEFDVFWIEIENQKAGNIITSIANNLVDMLGTTTSNSINYFKNPNPKTLFVIPVVSTEVQSINHDLDETKSADSYDLPPKIIKLSSKAILTPLTYLINASFSSGYYPTLLKYAKVIPIHKSKSPH